MSQPALEPGYLRDQIVGVDSTFETPFGSRLMVYCDYTASGRCLKFVEDYLQRLQKVYANTHTEDDVTGRSMTQLLHDAEAAIKESVNAGPAGRIIACGTGATGAIEKLQQIVGVALSPATRQNIEHMLGSGDSPISPGQFRDLLDRRQPVVFVGPYEHHSNEVSWRESLATTVEVRLDDAGHPDLGHLEELLQMPEYEGRLRIGSFSAASNVTGMRTDVRAITRLLHRHGALACFDYAACAPYVCIDMNPRDEPDDLAIDAIFLSPHKFIGGPGSSGVLVFNERIYHRELPPSLGAGGTVDYVGMTDQDYIDDIEEREKAGTPGVLQTLKAAIAFQIKDRVGVAFIEEREHELTARAMESWATNGNIEILGAPDPQKRVGIISFNVRSSNGSYLHHKFVTALLNDLFGIQSRAGCSCAGPYGHRLLAIDDHTSERYRAVVRQGYCGLKPGWCRIGLHWVMDDAEADYVIDAVHFVARFGERFLPEYEFDMAEGTWTHRQATPSLPRFSLDEALNAAGGEASSPLPRSERERLYQRYLAEAAALAEERKTRRPASDGKLAGEMGELQFFVLPAGTGP